MKKFVETLEIHEYILVKNLLKFRRFAFNFESDIYCLYARDELAYFFIPLAKFQGE